MAAKTSSVFVREAVGVFRSTAELYAAVDQLLSHGFDRADLSVMAPQAAIEAAIGHRLRRVEEAEDNATVPRRALALPEEVGDGQGLLIGGLMYVGAIAAAGAIVASGGTLAGTIVATGLAAGSGGLFGSALARFLGDRHADWMEEQLAAGGILLWVRCRDAAREAAATRVLAALSARDVHIHALPVAA